MCFIFYDEIFCFLKFMIKIGYQGVLGAYSSEASFRYFLNDENLIENSLNNILVNSKNQDKLEVNNYQFTNFARFEDVFKAVEFSEVDFGVIPLENSYAGRVAEIHNLFPLYNLYIVGEYVLPVNHKLLAKHNTNLEDVKQIYSHEQALMQCNSNISQTFASHNIIRTPVANTAVGAKTVADNKTDRIISAIASSFAAKLYNLKILKDNFADIKSNYTTFIIISKEPSFAKQTSQNVLTSILFTVRNIPASIYKSIGGFATNNVDLIKLESYIPGGVSSSAAQFFLTFKGHIYNTNVRLAMEELGFFATNTKLLGCYEADKKRFV